VILDGREVPVPPGASILDTGDPLRTAVSWALEAGSALIGILC